MSPSSGDPLPLEALSADGVGVLHSGALVRWIEVSPVNPLIHDTEGAEGISRAFTAIAARLPDDRQSLQLIAQATPLPVEAILAVERADCHSAADDARSRSFEQLAVAVERLGLAQEQSIRTQSQALAALELRYFVVAPWQPARARIGLRHSRRRAGPLDAHARRSTSAPHARAPATQRESAATLSRSGSRLRCLSGEEVARLMWARFAPGQADAAGTPGLRLELPGTLDELADPEGARAHAVERRARCARSRST